MTNQNPENAVEPLVQEEPQQAAPVAVFQPNDARRRLRELLSVPERERTDEQWDEIIELEIQLAPGNRIAPNESLGGLPSTGPCLGGGGGGGNPLACMQACMAERSGRPLASLLTLASQLLSVASSAA